MRRAGLVVFRRVPSGAKAAPNHAAPHHCTPHFSQVTPVANSITQSLIQGDGNTPHGYVANRNSMITERKGTQKRLSLHQEKSLRDHGRLAGIIYTLKT